MTVCLSWVFGDMKYTITLSWKGVLGWAAKGGAIIQHIKQSEIL